MRSSDSIRLPVSGSMAVICSTSSPKNSMRTRVLVSGEHLNGVPTDTVPAVKIDVIAFVRRLDETVQELAAVQRIALFNRHQHLSPRLRRPDPVDA